MSRDSRNIEVAGANFSRRLPQHGVLAPMARKGRVVNYVQRLHLHDERLIEMLDRHLEEEQVLRVDERLVRVVRIIVEQYDGDVRAFVESVRCNVGAIRGDESKSNNQGETAWRQHP